MTEYGRGPGPEPWHPEDPLYGDGGWEGQQAHTGQQQYPQSQQHPAEWNTGQYDTYGQGQPQHPYPEQGHAEQYSQQQYEPQQYETYPQQSYDNEGWATGSHQQIQYTDPSDPYGQQAATHVGEQADYYSTAEAYPPPVPPARRQAVPEPPETDWDPGPDQGEHAFFAGGDDNEDDDEPTTGRSDRRGRDGRTKKPRGGFTCLVMALTLTGGVAGAGYFGYQFYQDRFGSAPDYAGDGTDETVVVEIPKGALGNEIGQRLKQAGVVKSVEAFVAAQSHHSQEPIQAGAYLLHRQMSAESAVELMLDPKSQNNVLVRPGERNIDVYASIDQKLGLPSGATKKIAKEKYASFGLPRWANSGSNIKDPLEGFLHPGTYPAAKGMNPEAILKDMVSEATRKYQKLDLPAKAEALGLEGPLQLVTVASLVQAEGKTNDDYRKMAEVIYNRLDRSNRETYGLLQFDSTFNYLKGESNINISESEINSNQDPYNTYTQKGLPPGPIGNPGDGAFSGAMNPTDQGWYYFVAVDGVNNTEFAKTHAEFQRLKDRFNESSGN